MVMATTRPRVIVIGAGFGGLNVARYLADSEVEVLLIDRNNYHLFTPLLYQVATCGLDPNQIAYPVRGVFRNRENIRFLLGEVTAINHAKKTITVYENDATHTEAYDYLVIASGSVNNFFGNQQFSQTAFGMKDLAEAITLRDHIIRLFEKAAWINDEDQRRAMTTLVVIGGGPTGLETAGALYELYNYVIKQEYSQFAGMNARVILIEATDRLLAPYPENLRQAALDQLKSLGVEVRLNTRINEIFPDHVVLDDNSTIPTHTVIWAAGVKASPLAKKLDVQLERGNRIPVADTLEVIGREHIFAIGDIAYLLNPKDQQPYPQVSPVAIQQGIQVAKNIRSSVAGKPMEAFRYKDRGIMATIGRSRAVAHLFNRLQLTGWFAWSAWLTLHLVWLIGFRNKLSVLINWAWNYFAFYLTGAYNYRVIRSTVEREKISPEHVQS